MKKSTFRFSAALFVLLLIFAFTACQPAADPDSGSAEGDNTSRTLPEIAAAYRADIDTVAADYSGKLNDNTIKDLTDRFKKSLTDEEYTEYDAASETYLDEHVRPYFDFYLDYRTCGAADAPVAPDDYTEACEMIREEFKNDITDDNRPVFEMMLEQMETTVLGAQNPTPYSDSPQLHFDSMRSAFRIQELCTLDPKPDIVYSE